MKIVGLTGGIGSGKSTVAKFFSEFDIPIFIADTEAKKLMNEDANLKASLTELLGKKAYSEGKLNRKYVAGLVFDNKELLSKMNALVHPAVRNHFKKWVREQSGPYCIYEAAILFETGGEEECDATILVTAPKEVRIARILKRDNTTIPEIEARMANQWSDDDKRKLAHFTIENIDLEDTRKQVRKIHKNLCEIA
ncbi:dephospho-CoA kinase [Luteirhabdus pelagi]|uniref:dephospho-CoA kinase n=1 Tax=Luteirhabdus pelagi TaxID=2792783 RepID=UPI00193AB83A|nr:dephospho-CoA kinase [Luteirhabdus pelagi]